SGNDDDTIWMMQKGGAGVISVASNVAPEKMAKFVKALQGGFFNYKYIIIYRS
ncbi:MAG: dihydrodipicolinate synthase family protein, partial [Bacilli bacterium]|nr:dihydrodipicolinate synthase family protein [Bacilli bacterium]